MNFPPIFFVYSHIYITFATELHKKHQNKDKHHEKIYDSHFFHYAHLHAATGTGEADRFRSR